MESIQVQTSLMDFRLVFNLPVIDEDAVQAWLNETASRIGQEIERQYVEAIAPLLAIGAP